ncbi:MAG: tetratricopeptide repeat protein, partial [Gemmatimonadaceae bacterium]
IQIAQGIGLWQLPGFLLLVATLALGIVLRRRRPVISFGIAFVCIVLLPSSNFIIPAGIVLAERTLFLPSVGAMLVLGGMLVVAEEWLRTRERLTPPVLRTAGLLAALVILTGAIRSSQRTTVWKDNDTLFNRAVIDAPMAYRAHYMLGAWDFEMKRKRLGELEYRKALALFPYDAFLAYNLADQYRQAGMCGPALPLYEWSQSLDPNFPLGHSGYAWCLLNEDRFDDAKAQAYAAIRAGASLKSVRRLLFIADSAKAAQKPGSKMDATTRRPRAGNVVQRASNLPDSVQKTAARTGGAARR